MSSTKFKTPKKSAPLKNTATTKTSAITPTTGPPSAPNPVIGAATTPEVEFMSGQQKRRASISAERPKKKGVTIVDMAEDSSDNESVLLFY